MASLSDLPDVMAMSEADGYPRRPSLLRRTVTPLARLVMHLTTLGVVTLGGGVAAAFIYDWAVPPPEAPTLTAVSPETALPPVEPAVEGPAIDPLLQAIIMARADLDPLSLVDVQPRVESGVVFLEGEADSRRTIDHIVEAIGRVPGVVAVDARDMELAPRLHILAPGDNLIKLSHKYYGRGGYYQRIADANAHRINLKVLRVGETILIPPLD